MRQKIEFRIKNFEHVDSRFMKVSIRLMHLGVNKNGTAFSRKVVEDAIPTLAYTPILAFVDEEKNDVRGHEINVVKKGNEYIEEYMGHAYGAILDSEHNNARFVEEKDENGVVRTYLYVDGIIWKKFDKFVKILERDGIKGQSMEITDVEGEYDKNGIFHFTKFKFDGACVLGDDYEPAMHNAAIIKLFSLEDVKKDIAKKVSQFYSLYKKKGVDKSVDDKQLFVTHQNVAMVLDAMLADFYGNWFVYKDHDDQYVYTWLYGIKNGKVVYTAHPYTKREDGGVEIDFETVKYFEIDYKLVDVEDEEKIDTEFALKNIVDKFKESYVPVDEYEKEKNEKEQLKAQVYELKEKVEAFESEKRKQQFDEVIQQFERKFKGYEATFYELTENALEKYSDVEDLKQRLIYALGEIVFEKEDVQPEPKDKYSLQRLPKEDEEDTNYKSPYGNLKPVI